MRISDWSSDVCSSDLLNRRRTPFLVDGGDYAHGCHRRPVKSVAERCQRVEVGDAGCGGVDVGGQRSDRAAPPVAPGDRKGVVEGKSVSVRVDLGGRSIIKKKKKQKETKQSTERIIIERTR